MQTAYNDLISSLNQSFYKSLSGEVYEFERIYSANNQAKIEAYKLRPNGGLERVILPLSKILEFQNIGSKESFANKDKIINYQDVLNTLKN
ncbi:MAG: hypothetical protein ACP5OG_01960 [Candidatus Nanoarchaeia archaeon]